MMFVAESYIIAVVNGVIAFGFIMMADAPKDPTNLNSKCKFMLGLRLNFVIESYILFIIATTSTMKFFVSISKLVLQSCMLLVLFTRLCTDNLHSFIHVWIDMQF